MNRKSKTMKKFFKLNSLILVVCLLLSLVGCKKKISEQEVVGFWGSVEDQYLSYYGEICSQRLLFNENGTFVGTTLSVDNGGVLNTDYGTWAVEKGELFGYGQSPGVTIYTYDGKYLYNGIWKYERIG